MGGQPVSRLWAAVLLLVTDTIGYFTAVTLAYFLRFQELQLPFEPTETNYYWFLPVFLITFYIFNSYDSEHRDSFLRVPERTLLGVGVATLTVSLIIFLMGRYAGAPLGRGVLAFLAVLIGLWTYISRQVVVSWIRARAQTVRWLVLGEASELDFFHDDLKKQQADWEIILLGSRPPRAKKKPAGEADIWTVTGRRELARWLEEKPSGVIVATRTILPDAVIDLLMNARMHGTRVYDLTDFYERFYFKLPVYHVKQGWFALSRGFVLVNNPFRIRMKKLFDLFFSGLILLLTAPIMLVAAILVRLESPGPVIYRQVRTGLNGRDFVVYKFRSMRDDAEKEGARWASKGDARVTTVGRFLRSTRIDELPQILNVFRGDMSFIGPRPERPEFNRDLSKQIPFYDLRHLVKPGITGWAQVMYPYGASVEDSREKLQYDLYYIKNYSSFLDFFILLKTLRVVLFGLGR